MTPNELTSKLSAAVGHFKGELSTLRLGRAHPGLVENVVVNYYGTLTAMKQLASVTVSDAQTLVIQPWDKNSIKDVEQALQKANLGASPTVDGQVIRVNIPSLTEERRQVMVKRVKEITEQAKVAVRQIREEYLKHLKKEKETGSISEDKYFAELKEKQTEIDKTTENINGLSEEKQREITTV